ncbi:MAG: adenosylmethionine--8-amino-7-oxononanoate transaminase [Egibacteraceae bacterium]
MDTERLRELDRRYLWHPYTYMDKWMAGEPLVIERAEGCWLVDTDGRRYLDGSASMGVNVHGHRRAELDEALIAQVQRVAHTTTYLLTHPTAAELAARLVRLAPSGLERVCFSESGSAAIETALKMAYAYWQFRGEPERTLFVFMDGAYHGDTLGATSVGVLRDVFSPLLFPTRTFAQPYCYRCPLDLSHPSCGLACADTLEGVLTREGDRVAAVLVEPLVQGLAGIITAPHGHLARVAEIARRHGVLLIADEIFTGFGRTGTMFACEAEDVTPDLLALGKGLTGGYLPLSATLATAEIFEAFLGDARLFLNGSTYSGNPLATAVALASLDVFEQEDTVGRAQPLADILAVELKAFQSLKHVGDVRQRGMFAGVELVADPATHTPFPPDAQVSKRVCHRARELGLVINSVPGDVIQVVPALAMSPDDLRLLVAILLRAVREVTEG